MQWISRGVEHLLAQAESDKPSETIDLLIVGSGYGGSIAADHFSRLRKADGRALRVVILERGREYLPGSFPSTFAQSAKHVRFSTPAASEPGGNLGGLFDLRLGADVSVLVGNGLGGGSLINAGVMLRPSEAVLADERWPAAIREGNELERLFDRTQSLLGAGTRALPNTIDDSHAPLKFEALRKLAQGKPFSAAPIQVAIRAERHEGVQLDACIACGDCASGCNYQAKKSFDTTLLASAFQRGVEIYTGASVLALRKTDAGEWAVEVALTDKVLREREPLRAGADGAMRHREVRAARVILAAGSLGSTEILQRSASAALTFSSQLGKGFSSNGDLIAALTNQRSTVNAVGEEGKTPQERGVGPTITGVIDLRGAEQSTPIIVEEMGIPMLLGRLLAEVVTTGDVLSSLGEADWSRHRDDDSGLDPVAINPARLRHTSVIAMMGDDGANGELCLSAAAKAGKLDGQLSVRWPAHKRLALFETQMQTLEALAKDSGEKGRVLANPSWKMIPDALSFLVHDDVKGPTFTVHPLGGCRLAEDAAQGVVNDRGQVYDVLTGLAHENLCVLDGAIIPLALGVNPALTIATVAVRAVGLLGRQWGWVDRDDALVLPDRERPRYKTPEEINADHFLRPPQQTEIEIVERLSGPARLKNRLGGPLPWMMGSGDYVVELSLRFSPAPVASLIASLQRRLMVAPETKVADPGLVPQARSQLRIFERATFERMTLRKADSLTAGPSQTRIATDSELDEAAVLVAPVSGSMRFFHTENSVAAWRLLRASWGWFSHRGARDMWQTLFDPAPLREGSEHAERSAAGPGKTMKLWLYFKSLYRLATRAGSARLFEYTLAIGEPVQIRSAHFLANDFSGKQIVAHKRFTFRAGGNPLTQLTELSLDEFPLKPWLSATPVLSLQPKYLADRGVPLMRLVRQQDQPSSLTDLASLGLYFFRLALSIHLWSFRAPDSPKTTRRRGGEGEGEGGGGRPTGVRPSQPVNRLPQALPGLILRVHRLITGHMPGDKQSPVEIVLSRYCIAGPDKGDLPGNSERAGSASGDVPVPLSSLTPVLLIHGYSASGTTFAHPALPASLVAAICASGREAWVLDLRSSAGLSTATVPWTFEQVAREDIAPAVDFVLRQTGHIQVDVVAHCIGAVMFSMAILGGDVLRHAGPQAASPLHKSIRRAILMNKGPVLRYSPGNVLRAYIWRYYREFFKLDAYAFDDEGSQSPAMGLLDRLLSCLPYPAQEYRLENPVWPWQRTAFTRTRHRIDLLYGRSFSLRNLSPEVLARLDDFFGPLNIETVTQTLHFSARRAITTFDGKNDFVQTSKLRKYWRFPTLVLGAEENGLADPSTLTLIDEIMGRDAGLQVRTLCLPDLGHQDALIGKTADKTFRHILEFLARKDALPTPEPAPGLRDQQDQPDPATSAAFPWTGPHVVVAGDGKPFRICFGSDPGKVWAKHVAVVALAQAPDGAFVPVSGPQGQTLVSWPDPSRVADRQYAVVSGQLPLADWVRLGATHYVLLLYYPDPGSLGHSQNSNHPVRQPGDGPGHTAAQRQPASAMEVHTVLSFLERQCKSPLQSGLMMATQLIRRDGDDTSGGVSILPIPDMPQSLTFVLASCQYPAGMIEARMAYASMRHLCARLLATPTRDWPDMALFCGDQVYVDATAGLFDPTTSQDRYHRPYENWLRSQAVQSVFAKLPVYFLIDDHELTDNWQPSACPDAEPPDQASFQYRAGVSSFLSYQRGEAPPENPAQWRALRLWNDAIRIRGFDFFMADTRTERQRRSLSNLASARIMSIPQEQALHHWLKRVSDRERGPGREHVSGRPCFFASPSIVLPRRRATSYQIDTQEQMHLLALQSDAWDGYPSSLVDFLQQVWVNDVPNLVCLSGDEHFPCDADIEISGMVEGRRRIVRFRSIHVSALHAPYPFANGESGELALDDAFSIRHPLDPALRLDCQVRTRTFAEFVEGYGMISVKQKDARWRVGLELVSAHNFDAFA